MGIGIELALRFWEDRGHRTIGFLPDFYVNDRSVKAKRSMKRTGIGNVRAASLPDDTIRLKQMVAEGRVVLTPPQDYDDSYCIQYAKRYGCVGYHGTRSACVLRPCFRVFSLLSFVLSLAV